MISYRTGVDFIDWPRLMELYRIVGLARGLARKGEFDKIKQAFMSSFRVVTAWDGEKLVGAARLISDGICYGGIFDVGVLPQYQKMGVGRGLMEELTKDLDNIWLLLTSTEGNEKFYEKIGFKHQERAFFKK